MPHKMDPVLSSHVLDGLMRYSSVVMFVKDRQGRYLAVSDGWQAVTGIGADATLLQDDLAVFGPEVGGRFREADTQVLQAGEPQHLEETLPRPDGIHYFLSTKFPLRDDQGQLLGLCGVASEITPLRRMQQAIRAIITATARTSGEQVLPALIKQVSAIIGADICFIGKLDATATTVTTLAVMRHGLPADNFTYALAGTPCAQVQAGKTCAVSHQVQPLFPDDALLQTMGIDAYVGTPIRDASGQVTALIVALYRNPLHDAAFICDLFELLSGRIGAELIRQNREREIVELNAALERRVETRTRDLQHALQEVEMFNYCVSHDLKAPLRAIKGFSEILLEQEHGRLTPDGRELLGRVVASARQMQGQIDALNHLVRLDAAPMKRRRVDLSVLARQVVDMLLGPCSRAHLECDITDGLQADCDPALAELVLTHLLGNALKYSRPRKVQQLSLTEEWRNGQRFFVVKDNGVGFDMAYAQKLFAPFQRLHSARDFEGTGIGLAIVSRIIHRHGGDIWAEGEVGEGARIGFHFGSGSGEGGRDLSDGIR